MPHIYKIPLVLEPQSEGGYTVTSPALPEVVTEGATLDEVMANVQDAVKAALELYEDLGRPLPDTLRLEPGTEAITFECLVTGA